MRLVLDRYQDNPMGRACILERPPMAVGAQIIELFQALAILVVIGCIITLTWLFNRALGIGLDSKTFISYELILLMFIIIASLTVDYTIFKGDLLLKPLFGQGTVDKIHFVYDSMSYDLKTYITFMMSCIIVCMIMVLYYTFLKNK
jgi:hypothetical protein